jgi:hypothetical protein
MPRSSQGLIVADSLHQLHVVTYAQSDETDHGVRLKVIARSD